MRCVALCCVYVGVGDVLFVCGLRCIVVCDVLLWRLLCCALAVVCSGLVLFLCCVVVVFIGFCVVCFVFVVCCVAVRVLRFVLLCLLVLVCVDCCGLCCCVLYVFRFVLFWVCVCCVW